MPYALAEINELALDEHYSEFFKVMDFLRPSYDERLQFREVWSNYSRKLRELSQGDVCRTERISAKECADMIDDSSVKTPLKPSIADIKSYIQAQQLLDSIGIGVKVPVDYVKSSPYLLSFMRDYQRKRDIERYFINHPDELGKANKDHLWLQRNLIENFKRIDPGNARLELVTERAFAQKADTLRPCSWIQKPIGKKGWQVVHPLPPMSMRRVVRQAAAEVKRDFSLTFQS